MADKIFANMTVKCRENKLLGPDRLARLAEADGIEDCLKILSEAGFYEAGQALDTDRLMTDTVLDTLSLFVELSADPVLTEVFSAQFLFHNIKAYAKAEYAGGDVADTVYDSPALTPVRDAILSKSYGDLPEELAAPLKALDARYIDVTPPPSQIDNTVDKAMYAYIVKRLPRIKNSAIRKYYAAKIEWTNLLIAVRIRKNGYGAEEYGAYAIDTAGTGLLDFPRLAAAEKNAVREALSGTAYYDLSAPAFTENGIDAVKLEKLSEEHLIRLARTDRENYFALNPLFAYVQTRLVEAQNLKIILTAKLNNLSPEKIEERLRRIYE